MGPALAGRLQTQAGNRAVSRLVAQRKAATSKPAASSRTTESKPAVQKSDLSPATSAPSAEAADVTRVGPIGSARTTGRLVVQRLAGAARGVAQRSEIRGVEVRHSHQAGKAGETPTRSAEAEKAKKAAKAPPDDKQAQGKAAQAEKMNAAEPGEFNKAAFIKAVNDAIAQQAPKDLDDADQFAESGKADAVKNQVTGQVTAGKQASAGAIDATTKAAPDTSQVKDKQVTPLAPDRAPGMPAKPNPQLAVPDKAPPEATDFSAGPAQVKDQMSEAQVTEEQLAKSNEPEFTGALVAKKEGEQHAARRRRSFGPVRHRPSASTKARGSVGRQRRNGRDDQHPEGLGCGRHRRQAGGHRAPTKPSGLRSRRPCRRSSTPPRPLSRASSAA